MTAENGSQASAETLCDFLDDVRHKFIFSSVADGLRVLLCSRRIVLR